MTDITIGVLVGLVIGNAGGFAFALVWMAHRGYGMPRNVTAYPRVESRGMVRR